MRFKFNRNRATTDIGHYKTYGYVNGGIKKAIILRSEKWIAEDEFINSTTGADWGKINTEIEAAKNGQKTKLVMKRMNNQNYFKAINMIVLKGMFD